MTLHILAIFAAAATTTSAQPNTVPVAVSATPAVIPATVSPASPAVVAIPRATINGTNAFLPANTQVDVTLNSEVNSKKVKQGDHFAGSVSHDVMLGDYVIIPKGTPADGTVTYRTGKGAFGKSAKMEIAITNLNLGGRSIPVNGKFRQEGAGNTGATVGAVVAVGVFSAFVTGKSAVFEQGRELRVFTIDALPVTVAAADAAPAATPVATPIAATTAQ